MDFKNKLLKPGDCPFCEKAIYVKDKNGKPVKENDDHMFLWAKFNDDKHANFSCCKECFPKLNPADLSLLMGWQKYTWGMEIVASPLGLFNLVRELRWSIEQAVHLKIIKWSNTEDGLAS